MTRFVLVSAEGAAEVDGVPGIRVADPGEQVAFNRLLDQTGTPASRWYIDHTGCPYTLLAVEEGAPEEARYKAYRYKRCRRLFA